MTHLRLLIAILLLACVPAIAQTTRPAIPDNRGEPIPDEVKDVGIDEHLNAQIPLDLKFEDEQGKTVQLRDYFNGHRPVIIQLGYYGCPMLCGLVTNGLLDSMKELPLELGKDYEVVNVSINPAETSHLAGLKKENYLKAYGRTGGAAWHFLVGSEDNIRLLSETLGFKFKYDPNTKQFAHGAVIMLATPDGRMSRYLYGVDFPSSTLRLSLVEASEGKIGSAADKVLLTCFHFDPKAGRYSLAAMAFMRMGALLTALALGFVLVRQFVHNSRHKPAAGDKPGQPRSS